MPGSPEAEVAQPTVRICRDCVHYRLRAPVRPFAAEQIVAAGVLKELNTWEQEERQRAQQEYQAFLARRPFGYEPHSYAWCAAASREDEVRRARQGDHAARDLLLAGGAATLNPVTGELMPQYVLCAWENPTGTCERYVDKRH
jgi:hypothetical protein